MPHRPGSAASLATFLATAGSTHFLFPKFYDAMIPPALPGIPRSWTYGSGVAEVVVGASVAFPRTRRTGGLAAALLFIAVLPGNIQMALDAFGQQRTAGEKAVLLARLPVQLPLIAWGLRVRRSAGPPG
jgi:uncharacterized membrane protein